MTFHAAQDDRGAQGQKDRMAHQRTPGRGDKPAEARCGLRGPELQGKRFQQILHRPAAHHAIVGQDDDGGEDGQQAQPAPGGAGSQLPHGTKGIGVRGPTDNGLGKEDGQRQQERGQDVHQNKCCAAVFAHHVGETPDVAQADGAARHGHNDGKTTSEMLPACRHYQTRLERKMDNTASGAR